MIVQIDNTNTKAVLSGHVFKDDCPDRVDYAVNNGNNAGKFDAVIKSGHRDKDADKHDVNGVSGHASGHDVSLLNNKGHYKGQSVLYSDDEKKMIEIKDILTDMSVKMIKLIKKQYIMLEKWQ